MAGVSAVARSALALGEVPVLERYADAAADRYEDTAAAERAAALALSALELQAKRFEGIGAAHSLRAGARFSLIDHPSYGANTSGLNYAGALLAGPERDDNAFAVLAVEHEASNNLGSEAARLLGRGTIERGTYKNRFECVLAAVPMVPKHRSAPTAPAALSGRVVGLQDAVVSAERGHRVKVQMHFQRGERPNAGGRATGFGTDARGNAPGDERSGTWVRVAGPAAGANWGSLCTPRIGAEVVVQFIEGDIDRPVIAGALYDGTDARPFSAGIDSGVNHLKPWSSASEKHEEVMEWVVPSACLVTLALPLVMAAGVGPILTGIAGSELRAVMLEGRVPTETEKLPHIHAVHKLLELHGVIKDRADPKSTARTAAASGRATPR